MPEHASTDSTFTRWARGYGLIRHTAATRARIRKAVARLDAQGQRGDGANSRTRPRAWPRRCSVS